MLYNLPDTSVEEKFEYYLIKRYYFNEHYYYFNSGFLMIKAISVTYKRLFTEKYLQKYRFNFY